MPSSCYAGYTVAPMVDGIEDRESLNWSRAAWASSDEVNGDTWLRITFPESRSGGTLDITWATDSGVIHVSENYRLQYRHGDQDWQDASDKVHLSSDTTQHRLPDQPVSELRLIQPHDGGSDARPGLMWIAQLQLNP